MKPNEFLEHENFQSFILNSKAKVNFFRTKNSSVYSDVASSLILTGQLGSFAFSFDFKNKQKLLNQQTRYIKINLSMI